MGQFLESSVPLNILSSDFCDLTTFLPQIQSPLEITSDESIAKANRLIRKNMLLAHRNNSLQQDFRTLRVWKCGEEDQTFTMIEGAYVNRMEIPLLASEFMIFLSRDFK